VLGGKYSGRMGKLIRGVTDLATLRPDLSAEWHPTKNGDLTPRDVLTGAHKKVWWLCDQGHEWEAKIENRQSGRGCPICTGRQVLVGYNDLATTKSDLAAEWHPTKNGDLTPRDVTSGSNKKASWLCARGHEWETTINNRRGCPYCSGFFVIVGETDLITKNPGLAAEWHPSKNGDLTPRDVKPGTSRKAWWLCDQGHEWQAAVYSRNTGSDCPVCSGQNVLVGFNDLATTNPSLAAEWHPSKNGDLTPRDVTLGTDRKAWWLCDQGHEWQAAVYSRNTGKGCPVCSGRKVLVGFNDLATVNPSLAAEWHPTENRHLTPRDVISGAHKKAWWLCAQGHEWEAGIRSRHSGKGCPYCSGRFAIVGETDLATINPSLALEWHPTKNGELTPQNVPSGSDRKAWWLCDQGHEWETRIAHRASGSGCRVCSGQEVLVGFNDLETTNPSLAAEWHPTKNGEMSTRDITSGTHKRAWWICPQGHEWEAVIANRRSGHGCPRCAKFGYDQTSPGYLYLLRKEHLDLQQFGISNKPEVRTGTHQRSGWEVLDVMGPANGLWIVETETALGRFFRDKGVLLPRDYPDKFDGYSESWRSDELCFSTCAEMLEALRDWETKI
jgi:hypothetical protein